MLLASCPTNSSAAFRSAGKRWVEAGIWRESPGHRGHELRPAGAPFCWVRPSGTSWLPRAALQPTRLLLLLPWQLAAILYSGHYLISGFSRGVPGGWEAGLQRFDLSLPPDLQPITITINV